jgi:hypothetical protein
MLRIIRIVFTINLFFSSINLKASDSIPEIKKIISKNYSLQYSIKKTIYTNTDSIASPMTYEGILTRNSTYIYSKSIFGLGIFNEDTCFYVRTRLKSITIGPKNIDGAALIIPFYDPYEMISYAYEFKAVINQYIEGDKFIIDFIFKNNTAIMRLTFKFDNNIQLSSSFNVTVIYKQTNDKFKEEITYKFLPKPLLKEENEIRDFIEIKNGRYILKPKFKDYTVFNAFSRSQH